MNRSEACPFPGTALRCRTRRRPKADQRAESRPPSLRCGRLAYRIDMVVQPHRDSIAVVSCNTLMRKQACTFRAPRRNSGSNCDLSGKINCGSGTCCSSISMARLRMLGCTLAAVDSCTHQQVGVRYRLLNWTPGITDRHLCAEGGLIDAGSHDLVRDDKQFQLIRQSLAGLGLGTRNQGNGYYDSGQKRCATDISADSASILKPG